MSSAAAAWHRRGALAQVAYPKRRVILVPYALPSEIRAFSMMWLPAAHQWQQGQSLPWPFCSGWSERTASSRPLAILPWTAGADRINRFVSAPQAGHAGLSACRGCQSSKRLLHAGQA